jgi:hypothetical protein
VADSRWLTFGATFRMRILGIIALSIVLLIGGTFVLWPTYAYRYRITLEVEVDGAIKNGSSVLEVTRRWDPVPGRPITHYSTAAMGEAVFVDLGTVGNLFLLLTNEGRNNPEQLGAQTFHFDPTDTNDVSEQRRRVDALTAKRATAELRPDQLPMLVTFANLHDASTARVVRPSEFEQVFGAGVHLHRAWIEMTSDPITSGIESKLPRWEKPLPWLTSLGGGTYIERSGDPFRTNKGMFKRGL